MAASFYDLYRQAKASKSIDSLVRNTHTGVISPTQSNFLQKAQAAFDRSRAMHHTASYPTKEVPISALTDAVNSAFAGIKEARGEYSPEYEDYLWRLKRIEAYHANPAAFINNSRYNNSYR